MSFEVIEAVNIDVTELVTLVEDLAQMLRKSCPVLYLAHSEIEG